MRNNVHDFNENEQDFVIEKRPLKDWTDEDELIYNGKYNAWFPLEEFTDLMEEEILNENGFHLGRGKFSKENKPFPLPAFIEFNPISKCVGILMENMDILPESLTSRSFKDFRDYVEYNCSTLYYSLLEHVLLGSIIANEMNNNFLRLDTNRFIYFFNYKKHNIAFNKPNEEFYNDKNRYIGYLLEKDYFHSLICYTILFEVIEVDKNGNVKVLEFNQLSPLQEDNNKVIDLFDKYSRFDRMKFNFIHYNKDDFDKIFINRKENDEMYDYYANADDSMLK